MSKLSANNVIVSCSGLRLSADEASLFAELKPWAIILFSRNIQSPDQLNTLLDECRKALGQDDLLVLIDQEGGRVSRLPEAHWRIPPSPQVFSQLYQQDKARALRACYLNNVLIGYELKSAGININCAPMLDVPQVDAAGIIHERAYGDKVAQVIELGEAVIKGLQHSGVEAVLKHIPGHGRGRSDSHFELPRVEAKLALLRDVDFKPFAYFNKQSMAMSAHIIYQDIDPNLPGSISPSVVNETIRKQIGFDGLLMTDDINMHALKGSIAERATAAIDAGVDIVLHCSGDFNEMQSLLPKVQQLKGDSLTRALRAQQLACAKGTDIDAADVLAELSCLLQKK